MSVHAHTEWGQKFANDSSDKGMEPESIPPLCVVGHAQCCLHGPIDCSPPAPLSMGFSRQEDWDGLSFVLPGIFPDPQIEPGFLTFQANSLPLSYRGSLGK